MPSLISLKRKAENLLDIKEQIERVHASLPNDNLQLSIRHKLRHHEDILQQFELKERLVLLAHMLAQLKIALLTNDEEKLVHIAAKFLHSDVCSLDGIAADITTANEHVKQMLLLYKEFPAKPKGHTMLKKTIKEYAKIHCQIKKEFEGLVDIDTGYSKSP